MTIAVYGGRKTTTQQQLTSSSIYQSLLFLIGLLIRSYLNLLFKTKHIFYMEVPFSSNKQNIPAELTKIAEFAKSVDLCRWFMALKEFCFLLFIIVIYG